MFSQKKLKVLFNIFAIIVGIFAVIQMPLIGLPILGGVITQGILGGFSGKVGPVVGGKWKDIDYMRGYVVPANPNTEGQQAVRTKFANLVLQARQLLTLILQPFWDPFYSNMSGFNAWISKNYPLSDVNGILDENSQMTEGTLENIRELAATYTVVSGNITVGWANAVFGNGLSTDSLKAIAIDTSNNLIYYDLTVLTREDDSTIFTIPSGLTPADVMVYVFAYRGTGSELMVSDSAGVACTAG